MHAAGLERVRCILVQVAQSVVDVHVAGLQQGRQARAASVEGDVGSRLPGPPGLSRSQDWSPSSPPSPCHHTSIYPIPAHPQHSPSPKPLNA